MEISITDIFFLGADYGQLIMEEERDNEDWADAFQGAILSRKYSMPSQIAPRRQPHSEQWRNAKRKSYLDFLELTKKISKEQEMIFVKP